jgi:hypothetical protein
VKEKKRFTTLILGHPQEAGQSGANFSKIISSPLTLQQNELVGGVLVKFVHASQMIVIGAPHSSLFSATSVTVKIVLKHRQQTDPVKVSIWLEIFKRSVLNARPVYPFVVLTETLPVPAVSKIDVLFEDAGAISMKKIIETSVILDRSIMAKAKPVLFHAVVVDQIYQVPMVIKLSLSRIK